MGTESTFDWARATVKVTVPVMGTASESIQEVDIPLGNFWALVQMRSAEERAALERLVREQRERQRWPWEDET